MNSDLSAAYLRSVLSYDEKTGAFTRLTGRNAGKIAGCLDSKGHRQIRLSGDGAGRLYSAHRLAFFYVTGVWPSKDIDHINGNRDDNRWCNLREATKSENGANSKLSSRNTTGFKGVSLEKKTGRWNAYIGVGRKHVYVGTFDTPEEAGAAYIQKAQELFGEFARAV